MILIEVYRGYEIHEVEKKGRKMFQVGNSLYFDIEKAKIGVIEGMYGSQRQVRIGDSHSKEATFTNYRLLIGRITPSSTGVHLHDPSYSLVLL